jgi:ketosteroid isomerase-like protein
MGGMTVGDQAAVKRITELEAQRYQAMTDADVALLAGLFSPDLLYSHSDASTDSYESYLEKLRTGELDYGPLEHPEHSISVHGDCALVLGDMRGEVLIGGQLRVLNSKALSVWVRADGDWKLLAFQPTKYPATA